MPLAHAHSVHPLPIIRCLLADALLTLCLTSACVGGPASQPTPAPVVLSTPASPVLVLPVPSPSPIAQTYTVQTGDTLLSIAEQVYGDVTQWQQIYDANRDGIGDDPDALRVGLKLTIPPKAS